MASADRAEEPSPLDTSIVAVRFQGPLFFVSSERVFETVMEVGSVSVVILRLARLERVDATGAQVLAQIVRGLERRGITVLIKGVQDSHSVLFRQVGVLAALRHHKHLFVDFASALEHARSHVSGAGGRGAGAASEQRPRPASRPPRRHGHPVALSQHTPPNRRGLLQSATGSPRRRCAVARFRPRAPVRGGAR